MAQSLSKEELNAFLDWDALEEEMPEQEEEGISKDPMDFFRLHRLYLSDLSEMEKAYHLAMETFDPARHKKAALERYVTVYMMALHHVARQFHPLTAYGLEHLKKARQIREAYEELGTPLLTRITKENSGAFAGLLTRDKREEIDMGRRKALGAIRTRGEVSYPAGVLTYYLDPDPLGDGLILRIDWIYVAESFRTRGVGQFLLAELLLLAAGEPSVTGFSAEYPAGDMGMLINNFLASWNFGFDTGVIPEFICRLGEVENIGRLEDLADQTTLFSEIGKQDRENLLTYYFRVNAPASHLAGLEDKESYLDPDISCFVGDVRAPEGVLLAHVCPSGLIRVEELYTRKGAEDKEKLLIASAMTEAKFKFRKDREFLIPVEEETRAKLLDDWFPHQRTDLVVEAVMVPPTDRELLTHEVVEGLMALSEEELKELFAREQ